MSADKGSQEVARSKQKPLIKDAGFVDLRSSFSSDSWSWVRLPPQIPPKTRDETREVYGLLPDRLVSTAPRTLPPRVDLFGIFM